MPTTWGELEREMGDWFDDGGAGSAVDVVALLDCPGVQLLHRCVASGALVSLGTTSDGGALGVTITVDGRWRRQYFRDSETLTEWLEGAVPAVEAARALVTASSEPRERPRRSRAR